MRDTSLRSSAAARRTVRVEILRVSGLKRLSSEFFWERRCGVGAKVMILA